MHVCVRPPARSRGEWDLDAVVHGIGRAFPIVRTIKRMSQDVEKIGSLARIVQKSIKFRVDANIRILFEFGNQRSEFIGRCFFDRH